MPNFPKWIQTQECSFVKQLKIKQCQSHPHSPHPNPHSGQGSRLLHPSMLNTQYFKFGRQFQLSMHLCRDAIFMNKIFLLEKRISVGKKCRYAHNIYNTEDKLYILKLNGFERFPGDLLRPPLLSDISCVTRFFQNSQSVLVL